MAVTGFTVLKDFGTHYRLCLCRSVPIQTQELKDKVRNTKLLNKEKVKVGENVFKLDNSISRAKNRIFEYACCNDFSYFCTFTLDKDKQDRYDVSNYIKNLGQYIRNVNKRYSVKIEYILVPEKHKDGAWHMHGLFKGLPLQDLREFKLSDNIPLRLLKRIQEVRVYEWMGYSKRFGFNTVEVIKNKEACYKYITKYINKNLCNSITELNKKMYYCSRGLKKAPEIVRGSLKCDYDLFNGKILFDYSNDYVSIKSFDKTLYSEDDILAMFYEIK